MTYDIDAPEEMEDLDLLEEPERQTWGGEELMRLVMARLRGEETRSPEVLAQIKYFRSMPYPAYLKTSHWKELKKQRLQGDEWTCRDCGSHSHLQVHHVSYENFGNESMADLMTLCRDCHARRHGKQS